MKLIHTRKDWRSLLLLTGTTADDVGKTMFEDLDSSNDLYSSAIGNLIMVIVVLAFIVGLIIVTIRFLARRNQAWFQARSIRTLGGIGVGQNKSVQLIRIGNAIYIVGVGENVTLLEKLEDPTEIDQIINSLNPTPGLASATMSNFLSRLIPKRKASALTDNRSSSPETSSFQELFHSRMKQIGDQRSQLLDMLNDEEMKDGTKR